MVATLESHLTNTTADKRVRAALHNTQELFLRYLCSVSTQLYKQAEAHINIVSSLLSS